MNDQTAQTMPVVVVLPVEIDVTNASRSTIRSSRRWRPASTS